jgi:hypothetical protein
MQDYFTHDILTAPISAFQRISGLGQSLIKEMITRGELETVTIGHRRLVVVDSWRRLIAQKVTEPKTDVRRNPEALDQAQRRGRGRPRKAAANPK